MVFRAPGELDASEARAVREGLAEGAKRSRSGLRWLIAGLLLAALAVLLAIVGWFVTSRGDVSDQTSEGAVSGAGASPTTGEAAPSSAAEEPAEAAGTQLWLLSGDGTPMWTVELGTGSGPVQVLEDATAVGTYTWSGENLTVEFTRDLTMVDGFVVHDPFGLACTGSPSDTELSCVGTVYMWSYDPRVGFDEGEQTTFDVTATRQ